MGVHKVWAWGRNLLLVLLLAGVAGCASTGSQAEREAHDPLEGLNRATFSFNMTLDEYVLEPAATAYDDYVPEPAQTGIGNFLDNLQYPTVILNSFLQGEVTDGLEDIQRFVFNSTFGVFGLIDIATPLGIERRQRDFGMTLARWGVAQGPYVVLPVLGPSTLRDSSGLGASYLGRHALYPPYWVDANSEAIWGLSAMYGIHTRAELLPATRLMDRVADDPYIFMRESYLQQRARLLEEKGEIGAEELLEERMGETEPDPFDEEFFQDDEPLPE